jgi:zinc protease
MLLKKSPIKKMVLMLSATAILAVSSSAFGLSSSREATAPTGAPAATVATSAPATGQIKVQHVVSAGGIEAWLVEERSIPIISMNFGFEGGAYLDEAGKEGTASLLSGVLDEGAGPHDSQAFRAILEEQSITLSFSAGRDSFQGTLRTLSANQQTAFELARLALTEPRFDSEPVERVRGQILVSLKRQESNPNSIAAKALFASLYGDHPYGRPTQGTAQSVPGITKKDFRDYMARGIARDRLKIGVVGDIDAGTLARVLDEVFGALPATSEARDITPVLASNAGGNVVVSFNNPQSTMIFAGPAVAREDPDFIASYVLNYTLGGGGFASRLMHEVREKRGLTYGIYTYLSPFERSGLFVGQVASDNSKIAETLQITQAEIEKVRAEGVTASELEDAKLYLTGAFPLRFTSNASIAGQLLGYQLSGYDIDYINRRNSLIDAVTLEDVARAAQRLPSTDEMTFIVVGEPVGIE